ncbi:MAG: hypothetical protein ABI556_10985 [Gemmatimonadales bacterium]
MRYKILAVSAAILGATACVDKASGPQAAPTLHLTATITEANTCAVSVLDHDYSSIGQIRGDVPKSFVGTVSGASYHGFGCWVATSGNDGDLIVLFSGNNLGKPLAVGSYTPVRDILDETPAMSAQVRFQTSEIGTDKLVTSESLPGSVVVEATASGGRVIKVNTDVVRWYGTF